ncbi:hypothetical protein PEC301879_12470 [Pectobacterium carotovorum subsp. carotovorum]|nr:hypothetical protein PEC301879_12470 [Pectobacterium carotovorum subsp. carotovorum]
MQATQRLARYKQLILPMRLDIDVVSNGDLKVSPRWLFAQGFITGCRDCLSDSLGSAGDTRTG